MLEYVIRPFQSANSQGKMIIPSTPEVTTQKATITWGGTATATMPKVTPQSLTVVCCREQSTEKTRDTELVQIVNPNNPDQYIWVERAKTVMLDKKEKNDCASDWDQFSGVGATIAAALDDFAAAMGPIDVPEDSKCQQQWVLQNNTAQPSPPA